MSSNFVRIQKILNQAFAENFICLSQKLVNLHIFKLRNEKRNNDWLFSFVWCVLNLSNTRRVLLIVIDMIVSKFVIVVFFRICTFMQPVLDKIQFILNLQRMLHNSYFTYILKHQYKHQILMRLLRIEVSSKLLMPSALKMRMIEVKLKLCLELQCQVHNEKWPKSNPWKSEVMTMMTSRKILMIHWTWKASNRSLHIYLLLLVQGQSTQTVFSKLALRDRNMQVRFFFGRWFWNPEIWEILLVQPVFVKSILCAIYGPIWKLAKKILGKKILNVTTVFKATS